MWRDPIVEQVRAAREQLAADMEFDLSAIFEKLRRDQQSHSQQLIHRLAEKRTALVAKPEQMVISE